MPLIGLSDRTLIIAKGADAENLLQNVITPDLAMLQPGEVRPGALLTPQGKILFDFLISRVDDDGFRLDCRKDIAQDFIKRLTLYRLRAKVEIFESEQAFVSVSWQADSPSSDADSTCADRRFSDDLRAMRHYGEAVAADTADEDWHALRVTHGVAESGTDFELGDAFPHDVLFDQNGGVGLKKGCYVGQEVVSRMHHRGTARRRLVIVDADQPLPSPGSEVKAQDRPLGTLGTVCGRKALAIIRIDRAAAALAAGAPIMTGDVTVKFSVPAYASYSIEPAAAESGREGA